MWHGSQAAVCARRRGRSLLLAGLFAVATAAGCGGRSPVALPTGAGTPFPQFAAAYSDAMIGCRGLKTLSASIRLSGRAGGTKLAARIDSGFAAPAHLRLEGYPRVNFGGQPFFILVSSEAGATLVMPRDRRVLRNSPPAAIVEALAGVALGPADLREIVAGCGLQSAETSAARSFPNGWLAIDAGETALFLRSVEGRWRLVGAKRGTLTITYADFVAGRPRTVQVRTVATPGSAAADLVLRLSQIEVDASLDPRAFEVEVPPEAVPLTLEELRRAGPLGSTSTKLEVPRLSPLPSGS